MEKQSSTTESSSSEKEPQASSSTNVPPIPKRILKRRSSVATNASSSAIGNPAKRKYVNPSEPETKISVGPNTQREAVPSQGEQVECVEKHGKEYEEEQTADHGTDKEREDEHMENLEEEQGKGPGEGRGEPHQEDQEPKQGTAQRSCPRPDPGARHSCNCCSFEKNVEQLREPHLEEVEELQRAPPHLGQIGRQLEILRGSVFDQIIALLELSEDESSDSEGQGMNVPEARKANEAKSEKELLARMLLIAAKSMLRLLKEAEDTLETEERELLLADISLLCGMDLRAMFEQAKRAGPID